MIKRFDIGQDYTVLKRLKGYTLLEFFAKSTIIKVSKGQTRREAGAQSHGSSKLMRRDWKTARPPKLNIWRSFCFYSTWSCKKIFS
jgi:hypothetical protein